MKYIATIVTLPTVIVKRSVGNIVVAGAIVRDENGKIITRTNHDHIQVIRLRFSSVSQGDEIEVIDRIGAIVKGRFRFEEKDPNVV